MRRAFPFIAAIGLIVLAVVLFRSTRSDDVERVVLPNEATSPSLAPALKGSPRIDLGDDAHPAKRDAVPASPPTVLPPKAAGRTLTVRVIDPVTQHRWPHVEVKLVELRAADASGSAPGQTPQLLEFARRSRTTDDDGVAVFSEIAIGRHKLLCDGPAAFSDERTFKASGEPVQVLELMAWRSAQLTGLVLDETGAPIRDASISAMPLRESQRRTTGGYSTDDGTFRIPDVDVHEEGVRGIQTRVRASSPSWLDTAETTIDLRAGENELREPLVLHTRAATLAGRIVDAIGAPLNGVTVECRTLLSKSAGSFSTQSDDHGRFVFAALAPGRFALSCASICLDASSPIEVALGARVDVGDLKPPPEHFDITGFAYFENEKPAAGATVHLRNQSLVIAADGSFTFSRCSSQPVSLVFRWHEENEYVRWQQFERNAVPGSDSLRVVLKPRGAVFRLVDEASRALIEKPALEVGCLDRVGQASSYRFPESRGEFRLDLDDFDPPIALRFVVSGYGAFEMKYEPPPGGYVDRHVIEIPLPKL